VAQVTAPGSPAIEAIELYRFFRSAGEEVLALRGVSLAAAAGEIVAVVGPSGSGKSTLLACLAGLDEPAGGDVLVAGRSIAHAPEASRARMRAESLGLLLQTGNLVPFLTVTDNIRLAQRIGRKAPRSPEDILRGLGLADRASARPGQLSGGEVARAGLAVALAVDPPVLLADEPTGELDGETERQLLDLLRTRAGEGTAIVVVTHSSAVMAIADRVVRLVDGRVSS
jgi:putative ABC transport system ATP-binding protein